MKLKRRKPGDKREAKDKVKERKQKKPKKGDDKQDEDQVLSKQEEKKVKVTAIEAN